MIQSFRALIPSAYFIESQSDGSRPSSEQALRKLDMPDVAQEIRTLPNTARKAIRAPEGDRKGKYSIRVHDQIPTYS